MSHWIILPILLPLAAAVLLLAGTPLGLSFKRRVGLAATVLMLPVALKLLAIASGGDVQVYALGDWPAPVGIVLMLDRLSAMMLVLTSVLALASLLYAVSGSDALGRNFHALFQLQLMGINGAFLTGDIFNLFVFFEILLLASYGLLMHGGGAPRARAGLAYVVLNLVGSSVFLVGLGLLYGTLGTLNMADMALQVRLAPADDIPLIRTAATLLLVVFGLKAAMLPLFFWLPRAYGAASAPVAALFAIMTKVGIYAIVRTYNLGFSPEAEALAGITEPWLLPLALLTLALGAFGALAAQRLVTLAAYLVIVSIGTLLAVLSQFDQGATAAALYYLPHSTFATAALFLLADQIARRRAAGDGLYPASPMQRELVPGVLFFVAAMAVAGMPPLSGFLGKMMMLQSVRALDGAAWIWGTVLVSSLLGVLALARAGSLLFWKTEGAAPPASDARLCGRGEAAGLFVLIAAPVLMALFAGPLSDFTQDVAAQLHAPYDYVYDVLGAPAAVLYGPEGK